MTAVWIVLDFEDGRDSGLFDAAFATREEAVTHVESLAPEAGPVEWDGDDAEIPGENWLLQLLRVEI